MTEVAIRSTLEEANRRADRIRLGLESYAVLREDIAAAYLAQDWKSLGYPTWDKYVEAEFTTPRLALPREERRELVAFFRERGMSTRAIAAATGAARNTIKDDLRQVDQIDPPVLGIDGKTYTPHQSEPEVVDAEIVDEDEEPEQPAQRRKPITDQATSAGWEIRKAADRIARLLEDDRYARNHEQVGMALRGALLHAAETITAALQTINK